MLLISSVISDALSTEPKETTTTPSPPSPPPSSRKEEMSPGMLSLGERQFIMPMCW